MQYLKDEVRQRIIRAASEEFFTEGFAEASIRVIAKNAGISSGNVYRYFSSKALIFDEIVGDVYKLFQEQLREISLNMKQGQHVNSEVSVDCIKHLEATLLSLFESHRKEMSMLLFKSQGSYYEHIRSDLHKVTTQSIQFAFPMEHLAFAQADRQLWAESVASGIIESTCYLLANSNDQTPVAGLLAEYLTMYSLGMYRYFHTASPK